MTDTTLLHFPFSLLEATKDKDISSLVLNLNNGPWLKQCLLNEVLHFLREKVSKDQQVVHVLECIIELIP